MYAKLDFVNSLLGQSSDTDDKLLVLAAEIDAFCAYDAEHSRHVATIADALGKEFKLSAQDVAFLDQAALVRDIGQKQMGRGYIAAARELTQNERFDLERHPVIGEQETAKLGLPRGVQLIVRWHHEWWNGNGYPDHLEAEQIPLTARILRVADTYAALTSPRTFRSAMSEEEARRFLAEWAGIEFDPEIARALLYMQTSQSAAETTSVKHSLSVN